ncbi:MAG: tetratricopeptide repeat protein, partial [Deltaproteobacteria bacterium]|nr:tetratricopeptide repeat protein [Deltaproteobacteria bacterium]
MSSDLVPSTASRPHVPRAISLLFLLTVVPLAPACGATTGSPAAQMLSDQGAQQLADGRLDEAEASLRLALEVEPGSAPAHANLGLVRLARGDLEGAESSLRGAIHAREDFVEAWSDLGVVLERRGQLEQAEAAYERALSINPLRPEPRLALARLLVRRARP